MIKIECELCEALFTVKENKKKRPVHGIIEVSEIELYSSTEREYITAYDICQDCIKKLGTKPFKK